MSQPKSNLGSSQLLDVELIREPAHIGKLHAVYDLAPEEPGLIIVTSDRISAFNHVLSDLIPNKGCVINQMSAFWFAKLRSIMPNHLVTINNCAMPLQFQSEDYKGRSMRVLNLRIFPVQCLVSGYLTGPALESYREKGSISGIKLPSNLTEASKLPAPVLIPMIRTKTGQNQPITFGEMTELINNLAFVNAMREMSYELYSASSEYALKHGIIIADAKFEFGMSNNGEVFLAGELLTPDSSHFWPADGYEPGRPQPSYDKQPILDWLEANWDGQGQPPALPPEIIEDTSYTYIDIFKSLTNLTLQH